MRNLITLLPCNRPMQLLFLVAILLWGCASPSERRHPQFASHRQPMGVMLVLSPEIHIFEQMPDGSQLLQESQSQEAQSQAQASIAQALRDRRFTVRTMDTPPLPPSELSGLTALFRSVNRSIQLHTFGPQIYPHKLDAFEYNVGPVANLLNATGADGLVMAIGFQCGAGKPDKNWLSIAVVEPQGSIIWYNVTGRPDRFDLHHHADISAMVAETMRNFWGQGS